MVRSLIHSTRIMSSCRSQEQLSALGTPSRTPGGFLGQETPSGVGCLQALSSKEKSQAV